MGNAFYQSGYFGDVKSQAQAIVKMSLGRAWGMSAADAMKHIYFINGRPAVMEEYTASKMKEAGWDWEPQWIGGEGPACRGVRLFLSKDGKPLMRPKRKDDGSLVWQTIDMVASVEMEQVSVSFTLEQANSIKVWEKGAQKKLSEKAGPWSDGWAQNQMYWRCIAQVRRFHCPNILSGAVTPEEAREMAPLEVVIPEATGVFAEIKKAVKAETKPAPADTKQPEPETKAPDPEAEKPKPDTKQPAPITKQTFSALSKIEAVMTTEKFNEFLQQHTFKNLSEIKFEADGAAMLMRLKDAQTKP